MKFDKYVVVIPSSKLVSSYKTLRLVWSESLICYDYWSGSCYDDRNYLLLYVTLHYSTSCLYINVGMCHMVCHSHSSSINIYIELMSFWSKRNFWFFSMVVTAWQTDLLCLLFGWGEEIYVSPFAISYVM